MVLIQAWLTKSEAEGIEETILNEVYSRQIGRILRKAMIRGDLKRR